MVSARTDGGPSMNNPGDSPAPGPAEDPSDPLDPSDSVANEWRQISSQDDRASCEWVTLIHVVTPSHPVVTTVNCNRRTYIVAKTQLCWCGISHVCWCGISHVDESSETGFAAHWMTRMSVIVRTETQNAESSAANDRVKMFW